MVRFSVHLQDHQPLLFKDIPDRLVYYFFYTASQHWMPVLGDQYHVILQKKTTVPVGIVFLTIPLCTHMFEFFFTHICYYAIIIA